VPQEQNEKKDKNLDDYGKNSKKNKNSNKIIMCNFKSNQKYSEVLLK